MAILVFEGYSVHESEKGGYISIIDGSVVKFDTVCQFVEYVKLITRMV